MTEQELQTLRNRGSADATDEIERQSAEIARLQGLVRDAVSLVRFAGMSAEADDIASKIVQGMPQTGGTNLPKDTDAKVAEIMRHASKLLSADAIDDPEGYDAGGTKANFDALEAAVRRALG